MPKNRVITVEQLAGRWIVYGLGYFSMHDWRSLAVLTAECVAAREGGRVVVTENPVGCA